MRYAILAFAVLLPLAIWWRTRGDQGSNDPSEPLKLELSDRLILLIFTLSVVLCVGIAIWAHGPAFVDDAYISYRYAQNLASGSGLAWNAGEAPLEGFTNLLLVLMMAPVVGLGADPLLATRILSVLSVFAVSILLYRVAVRHLGIAPTLAYLAALAYPMATLSIPVAMIGLESSLYTYLIFQAFVLALDYRQHGDAKRLGWIGALCFLALLLRPGAVFLLGALALSFALWGGLRSSQDRRAMVWMLLAFALPLALYLGWKLLYFGTVIPNPARIKMAGEGYLKPLGFLSVTGYLLEHSKLVLLALVSLSLPVRLGFGRLAAALLIAIYAGFYVGVDTLMDMNHRFLHPVTPFLFLLAMPTIEMVGRHLLRWRESVWIKLPVTLVVLYSLLFLYPEGPVSYARIAAQDGQESAGVEGVLEEIGRGLAAFPGAHELTIMSQDAGLVPYFTRARHLDTAGLNDPVVGRGGDPQLLADYLFGEEPTLIIHRGRKDGKLLDYAHGPLGDQSQWASHPGWDDYRHVGSREQPGVHNLHFFVRSADPRADELTTHLEATLITHDPISAPLPMGSRRQAAGN